MNNDQSLFKTIALPALITGLILLIPLIAMQFSDEVVWTAGDFIFAGLALFAAGVTYTLTTRAAGETVYRIAMAAALLSGLMLIWVNGAVGIIGSEDNMINMLYYGVFLIGLAGGFVSLFKARGMMRTMYAMAAGQGLVTAVALLYGAYRLPHSSVSEILAVNGFFITLFVVSALLFRHVIEERRQQAVTGEG